MTATINNDVKNIPNVTAPTAETNPPQSLFRRSLNHCVSVVKNVGVCGIKAAGKVAKWATQSFIGVQAGPILSAIPEILASAIIKKTNVIPSSLKITDSVCPAGSVASFYPKCPAEPNFFCKAIMTDYEKIFRNAIGPEILQGGKVPPAVIAITLGATGIVEEILFRYILQDVILKDIPAYIIKKIAPGKESFLDSKIYTVARVVLSSAGFSATHLLNLNVVSDAYVTAQVISTFVKGIFWGTLKELGLGTAGTAGAHVVNNVLAVAQCMPNKKLTIKL